MSLYYTWVTLDIHVVIASFPGRGVARSSPMLGHSMGILRLYEILRKVQKHLGGLGHALSAYAVSV